MSNIKRNWYILVSLTVAIISIMVFNRTKTFIFYDLTMSWNAAHYAINYLDFGFVKRGLIGSLYRIINGSFSQESLFLFQLSFLLLFIAITHYFFSKLELNKSFVYVLFILSPATFMQFGSDFGRFDAFLVSLFMLSIIFRRNSWLFILFSTLGVLTHEIYTFALLPASFLLYLSERTDLPSLKEIITTSLKTKALYILIASILLVISLGSYELGYEKIIETFSRSSLPQAYIEHHTTNNTGFPLEIWTRSISDNLDYTAHRLSLNISTVYMMFIYYFLLFYFRIIGVNLKKPQYYIILISSFPMFILGTDWGRWLAFIFISLFVIFIVTERDKAADTSNKYLLAFSLYGPLGIGGFLPLFILKFYVHNII